MTLTFPSPPDTKATKDPSSSQSSADKEDQPAPEDDDFSSRAQVMTLMTTDVDRVSEFAWHLFSLIGEWVRVFGWGGLRGRVLVEGGGFLVGEEGF